jgi:glyoxylase-like metal-dependent hydrolase (beta-lactamase superfamily II)
MKSFLLSILFSLTISTFQGPEYKIQAVRYGTIPQYPVAELVVGAPEGEKLDIPLVFWILRGEGRNILFDCGFHRENWIKEFGVTDFIRPDKAVRLAGLEPSEVSDIVLSHAHWDHMGGIDLFPDAVIWIQKAEYEYYTGPAWQEGGDTGGIDPDDMVSLVRRNTQGKLRFISGDDVEILPGIRGYTGGRHTYASQYLLVETDPPVLLASDNAYMYLNLEKLLPIATFDPDHGPASVAALKRMLKLAGSADRIIPGHDPSLFDRFPGDDRVVVIRE